MEVISRADAKARGLKTFFIGVECRNHHVAERRVSNGQCIVCALDRGRRYRETHVEQDRQYRKDNADRKSKQQRQRRLINGNQIRERSRQFYKANPEYAVWMGLKARCLNPKNPNFKNYGGRGVQVDEKWVNSYEAFRADVGPRPSLKHTIDRYPGQRW